MKLSLALFGALVCAGLNTQQGRPAWFYEAGRKARPYPLLTSVNSIASSDPQLPHTSDLSSLM